MKIYNITDRWKEDIIVMTTMKYLYVIPYNAYVEGMQVVGRVFIKNMLYYVIQGKRFFD